MTVLNGFIKGCCVTAICCSVMTVSSFAEEADSAVVSKLVASAKGETTPSGVQSALCKQASVWSGKFSFRSGGGNMCHGAVGAVALLTCKGYKDKDGPFEDSGCYKTALKSVGSNDPEASATSILIGAVKSTSKTVSKVVKPLVCVAAPVLLTATGVGAAAVPVIGTACGIANTASNAIKNAKNSMNQLEGNSQEVEAY